MPCSVLSPTGRIDHANSEVFRRALKPLIERCSANGERLVLDLAGVDYVSSAGLRVFLMTAQRMEEADGKLGLAGVQELIKDVFDMAGFDDMFEFYPTPAEAISGLA